MKAVLFSGGYDSTYLLQKLAKKEKEIIVFTVETDIQAKAQIERENNCRKIILDYLKAKYYNCQFHINKLKVSTEEINLVNTSYLNQPLFWLPIMSLLTYENIDLELSYITGDQTLAHKDDIINILNSINNFKPNIKINVEFPLIYLHKYEILINLYKDDKFLFENCTSCESTELNDDKGFCGNCVPCDNLKSAIIHIITNKYDYIDNDTKLYFKDLLRDKFKLEINELIHDEVTLDDTKKVEDE